MGYLDPRHYTVRLRLSNRARYRIPRTAYRWLKHQDRRIANLANSDLRDQYHDQAVERDDRDATVS